ncbi:MAG: GFA family protein [Rubrivivax sp.]
MRNRSGGCLCAAVRYEVTGEPLIARVCWCRDCQKISANGTANAIYPVEAISISGPTTTYTSPGDSGNPITRHFCATCGCHLFASAASRPQFRVVRVGTLDDPSSVTPVINMWTASAPRWACLDAALQSDSGQPAAPQQRPIAG